MWTVPTEMLWMWALVCQWGTSSWAFPSGSAPPVAECWYAGQRVVLLSDRVQVGGRDILLFNKVDHTWTMFVSDDQKKPALSSQDVEQILGECKELGKKLQEIQTSGGGGVSVFGVMVALLTAVLFIGLVFLSFKYPDIGSVGGVLGSLIHYPAHLLKRQCEKGQSN